MAPGEAIVYSENTPFLAHIASINYVQQRPLTLCYAAVARSAVARCSECYFAAATAPATSIYRCAPLLAPNAQALLDDS